MNKSKLTDVPTFKLTSADEKEVLGHIKIIGKEPKSKPYLIITTISGESLFMDRGIRRFLKSINSAFIN